MLTTRQGVPGLQEGLGMFLRMSIIGSHGMTNLSPLDREEEEGEEGDLSILIDSYTPAGLVTSRPTTEI
jgi:hypothetical protein